MKVPISSLWFKTCYFYLLCPHTCILSIEQFLSFDPKTNWCSLRSEERAALLKEFISNAHLPAITKCFLCAALTCSVLCCDDPCKLPVGWIMTACLRRMPAPCCDAGLWCVCRLGMTEWLFIISADRSNSPAGLPRSRSQFLSLFTTTLLPW